MDHYNALRGTLTSGGAGNVTVSDSASGRALPLSALPVGWSGGLRFDDAAGAAWELSKCTVVSVGPTVVSRDTVLAGSNGASKVALTVGMTVQQVLTAEQCNAFLSVADIGFSTAIPLTRVGDSFMPQQTVAGALTFTQGANAVRGALVYLRLVADGVNAPNFSAFKEWGGSSGYDNRNAIVNQMQFFYDGYDYWFTASQAVGAVAVDNIPPTASSAAVSNSTPTVVSISASESLDTGFVPLASAFTVSGHAASSVGISGSTINITCSTPFTNGEAARTVGYAQPSTSGVRDLAGNLMASFSGRAITNNVGVVQTVPAQMVAPVAVAGIGSAAITLSAPNNGNSPITGYAVTSSPPGGVDSAAGTTALTRTITGLTGGVAYTFTVIATNQVGPSPASPSSNSITPTGYMRMGSLLREAESGSGPYTYIGSNATGFGAAPGEAICNKFLPANTDGYLAVKINTAGSIGGNEVYFGASSVATTQTFGLMDFGLIGHVEGYGAIADHSGAANVPGTQPTGAVNDWLRLRRTGSVVYAECSKDSGSTWIPVGNWTGRAAVAIYFHSYVTFSGSYTVVDSSGLV